MRIELLQERSKIFLIFFSIQRLSRLLRDAHRGQRRSSARDIRSGTEARDVAACCETSRPRTPMNLARGCRGTVVADPNNGFVLYRDGRSCRHRVDIVGHYGVRHHNGRRAWRRVTAWPTVYTQPTFYAVDKLKVERKKFGSNCCCRIQEPLSEHRAHGLFGARMSRCPRLFGRQFAGVVPRQDDATVCYERV